MRVCLCFIFSLIFIVISRGEELQCFQAEEERLQVHFSTKTPYRVVANRNDDPISFDGMK